MKTNRLLFILFVLLIAVSCSKAAEEQPVVASPSNDVQEVIVDTSAEEIEEEAPSIPSLMSIQPLQVIEEELDGFMLGDTIRNFDFMDISGEEYSIEELLEQKELILINFFSTKIIPSIDELVFIQQAYEEYKDRVAVISLSIEETDSLEYIKGGADPLGITFLMGRDENDILLNELNTGVLPTSIVVDRFGKIACIDDNAYYSKDAYVNLFEYFLSEDYTETRTFKYFPGPASDVAQPSAEDLYAALDANSERIVFNSLTDKLLWPMVIEELDGKTIVKPSNLYQNTSSTLSFTVDGKAGESIKINFKTEPLTPLFLIEITANEVPVKYFSGPFEWFDYIYEFESDGNVDFTVNAYRIFEYEDPTPFYIDSIVLLDQEETAKALEHYYIHKPNGKTDFKINNESAKRVTILDQAKLFKTQGIDTFFFIADEDHVDISLSIDDYPGKYVLFNNSYGYIPVDYIYDRVGYRCIIGDIGHSNKLYEELDLIDLSTKDLLFSIYVFNSEMDVEDFLMDAGLDKDDWEYSKDQRYGYLEEDEIPEAVDYTVKYVDQNNEPISNATFQVCDDNICQVFVTDENGKSTFSLPPQSYEIHTLALPDGYEMNLDESIYTLLMGGTIKLEATKN